MFLDVLIGVFSLANAFIALFIVIYAFLFLKKTKSHKERRPWDYLVIASMTYLIYTVSTMLLTIYGINKIFTMSVNELNMFFQFVYTGLILLAFISQTDLIFKNEIIIITRKVDSEEKAEVKVELPEPEAEEKQKEPDKKKKK